jgi:hypothetical protein
LTDTVFNSYNTSAVKQLSDKFTTILTDNPWKPIIEREVEDPVEKIVIVNSDEDLEEELEDLPF